MMWGADNDGDPVLGEFTDEVVCVTGQGCNKSAPDVHGVFFLNYPKGSDLEPTKLSYNWWSGFMYTPKYDFGPRRREEYRDFTTGGTGWPMGDANSYHVMSNGEIDYDVLNTAAIGYDHSVWLPPPSEVAEMASTRGLPAPPSLLSIGPFDIPPGYTIEVPLAFVCGEDFHTDPNNIQNLPHSPNRFYAGLDFSDLINNTRWAKWVYDNPGVDTDGDKYRGEFVVNGNDTVYYSGDGIPDWRGAMPPTAPKIWLEPLANGLNVRFNGYRPETEKDPFTGKVDFEGYRIYIGLDEREASMSLAASYDKPNYDKYVWNGSLDDPFFGILDPPFTLDSLRCLYGDGVDPCNDSDFNPLSYTLSTPYVHPDFNDSLFIFREQDYNVSEFGVTTPITKIYPNAPDPRLFHSDSIPADAYTPEGNLKYFEYQYTFEGLLATVPYWVSVTAFDHGQPLFGLIGLESSISGGAKSAYPLGLSVAAGSNSKVYVYPNPYRIDADYRDLGFEGRTEDDRPDYRVRALNFGNLPPKCSIQIYSLDGDLIRELDHDFDPGDPNSSHDSWNMITRNTQMVVSGLYYWVVEADNDDVQMGKFVVIM